MHLIQNTGFKIYIPCIATETILRKSQKSSPRNSASLVCRQLTVQTRLRKMAYTCVKAQQEDRIGQICFSSPLPKHMIYFSTVSLFICGTYASHDSY